MLEAYTTNQTILTDAFIPFNAVSMVKGATVKLSGSTTIQLNKRGAYLVTCSVSGLPSTATNVIIQMTKNGVPQPQAVATIVNGQTTEGVFLSINTIVQVGDDNTCCCGSSPTTIQFLNDGAGLTNAVANVVVTKIC